MPFKEYESELQRNLKSGHATEPTYYPALKSLLENLDSSISVLQNPSKIECGLPDFRVSRRRSIEFPIGIIEAKAPGEDLAKIERSDQMKRYLGQPNVILTDFLEFRWHTGGKERFQAALGSAHLDSTFHFYISRDSVRPHAETRSAFSKICGEARLLDRRNCQN